MEGTEAFLWSAQVLQEVFPSTALAHIGCLIGCERNISDGELPLVIEDSSSLSAEFHIQIVPCPGAGHREVNGWISLV